MLCGVLCVIDPFMTRRDEISDTWSILYHWREAIKIQEISKRFITPTVTSQV